MTKKKKLKKTENRVLMDYDKPCSGFDGYFCIDSPAYGSKSITYQLEWILAGIRLYRLEKFSAVVYRPYVSACRNQYIGVWSWKYLSTDSFRIVLCAFAE